VASDKGLNSAELKTDSLARGKMDMSPRQKKAFLAALILSGALHTGALFGPKIVPDGLFARARDKIVSLFRSRAGFVEQLRESKEMRENMGLFFLKSEYYEGGIDEDELDKAEKKLEEIIENFRQMAEKDKNVYRVLHELIQEQAAYKGSSSYLSRLLLTRKGNCEARAKLMISVTNKIYPDLPVKLQMYRDHIRAIVQIGGQWYSMEKPSLEPIMEDDLKNTVLAESSIFVQSYLNEDMSAEEVEVTGNPNPAKKFVTDSFFTGLVDPETNQKLADYSEALPPDEMEEGRYEFEEVSQIPQRKKPEEPIRSVPPRERKNIRVTLLTRQQTEELLSSRNWFPEEWYEQLNEREKGLVVLYREKKYETLIGRIDFVPLKSAIAKEAKGHHRILNRLQKTARKIAAEKDISQRRLILCKFKESLGGFEEPDCCKKDYNRWREFQKLGEQGLKIRLDETVDFFILWQSLQELCDFPESEFGPDEEECNEVFKNKGQ